MMLVYNELLSQINLKKHHFTFSCYINIKSTHSNFKDRKLQCSLRYAKKHTKTVKSILTILNLKF